MWRHKPKLRIAPVRLLLLEAGSYFVLLGHVCDILAALSEAFVLHSVWDKEEEEGGIKL